MKTINAYTSLPTTQSGELKAKVWTTELNKVVSEGFDMDCSSLPESVACTIDGEVIHAQSIPLILAGFERCFGAKSTLSIAEHLRLAEAGYLTQQQADTAKAGITGVTKLVILPGHYMSAQTFWENSIIEHVDLLTVVNVIMGFKDTDTKANILSALRDAIALPTDRQAAIDEAYRKEAGVQAAMSALAPYLEALKASSDKSLTGCVRLDLSPEDTQALQDLTNKDSGLYPLTNINVQPAKMDGFIQVSPARYFLTLAIKD